MEHIIQRVQRAWSTFQGYNEADKAEYKNAGMAYFKAWVKQAGIKATLRYNKAGVAVAGDITMKGEGWEAFICEGLAGLPPVLVRTVNADGRNPGMNHWFNFRDFINWRPSHLGLPA